MTPIRDHSFLLDSLCHGKSRASEGFVYSVSIDTMRSCSIHGTTLNRYNEIIYGIQPCVQVSSGCLRFVFLCVGVCVRRMHMVLYGCVSLALPSLSCFLAHIYVFERSLWDLTKSVAHSY